MYKEKVGDRWIDPDDGEVVEIIRVYDNYHQLIPIKNCSGNFTDPHETYPNDAVSSYTWAGWKYLGNFNKAHNIKSLYEKLSTAEKGKGTKRSRTKTGVKDQTQGRSNKTRSSHDPGRKQRQKTTQHQTSRKGTQSTKRIKTR